MVEFVMLGTPALLLFTLGIALFANSYSDTMLRSIAIDSSRYAALADQDVVSARIYLSEKLSRLVPGLAVVSQVQLGSVAVVELDYSPMLKAFNWVSQPVKIIVDTPIENQ